MVKKPFLHLDSPIQYIKGVGPKRASYFKKLGVEIVKDLLFLVPRRYLDYSTVLNIKDLKVNDEATIIGKIQLVDVRKTKQRGDLVSVLLSDNTDKVVIKWFNRPDLKKKFKIGDWLIVSGKLTFFYGKQFINPLYEIVGEEDLSQKASGSIIPIYPLTEGLSLWDIKRAIKIVIEACIDEIEESLPFYLLKKNNLFYLFEAIRNLHLPNRIEDAIKARQRLVYDEFFYFELTLAKRKKKIEHETGIPLRKTGILIDKFLELLPFKLTPDQMDIIDQISFDMEKTRPMNRLLQGDVGSGKTVVALYAMLIAVENDCQGTLMVPTEILAEQHYLFYAELLEKLGVSAVLLTSSIKGSQREEIVKKIVNGEARIVIGTHALIEEQITFKKLGLVVVDEQHRFGVMQRAALVNKGINPDFLVLSATPIPRTIALTLYGDLDISTLKTKPPGRGEVFTKIVRENMRKSTFQIINQQLLEGRQAFIICPIIEKSEKLELKSVNDVYQEVVAVFPNFSVGIIHGRMKTDERIKIMDEFRRGKINILVATTVIEVGVDIPNATVMIIEHPERFGLAQLHQLRGRIGRGAEKSYCFLFLNRFVAPETYERITFFTNNNDGFALARKDMKLRGPGEILGKRQHGLPDIKIGDIDNDQDLLFLARDDAFEIVKKDPDINLSEHHFIRRQLQKFATREHLLRIG